MGGRKCGQTPIKQVIESEKGKNEKPGCSDRRRISGTI